MYSKSNDNNSDQQQLGSVLVNIEGSGSKLTHFIVAGDENDPHQQQSGVLLCATDQPKMDSFYVPALGVAPRWCSYLENITEELEEQDLQRTNAMGTGSAMTTTDPQHEAVFENYKFVTRDELDQLGVSNLIGTPLLRGYMHGFFMDVQLYHRVRAVAKPFEYEQYKKEKVKQRLKEKQASRIAPRPKNASSNKAAAVNPDLATRLQRKVTDSKSVKAAQVAQGLLSDDRFGTLFTNPDFEIDEEDEDFKLRNPSGVAKRKRKQNNLDSSDEDDDDDDDSENGEGAATAKIVHEYKEIDSGDEVVEDSDSDSDEDDGIRGGKVRGEAYEAMKRDRADAAVAGPAAIKAKTVPHNKLGKSKKSGNVEKKAAGTAILREADDLGDALGFVGGVDTGVGGASQQQQELHHQQKQRHMTLAERKKLEMQAVRDQPQVRIRDGGSKEVTFIPRGNKVRAKSDRPNDQDHGRGGTAASTTNRNRRGVKALGFKKPFQNKR